MSELSQVVDALEFKLKKLADKLQTLQASNDDMAKELERMKEEYRQVTLEKHAQDKEIETLRIASSMLGSEDYKKETKLKINAIIREIDACITQLSI